MSDYQAPINDMMFALKELAGIEAIGALPGLEEATPDLAEAILGEAGRLASEVLAPLNHSGDQEGSTCENGVVRTPRGFPEAYAQFAEAGWGSLPFPTEYGGQALPWTLGTAVQEMWQSANLSFALCPMLTQGAIDLLDTHGSEAQKSLYLPKLISGQWTGTMNLTESQAGSDVGAVKTRAEPAGDHYRLVGQKIFITWGEHDCAENIVHMVLARTPGAPAGTKGLSLFLVPKFLPKPDGTLGPRNDLRCVSVEAKLGIHASPTCVMAFGDSEGARGELVGEVHGGIAAMFTMMNNARIAVGIQGLAIAERAYQQASAYARERVQGQAPGDREAGPIIGHPDVRRMLMTMKSQVEAMRAVALVNAATLDRSRYDPDPETRARCQSRVDLLTPVIKGWFTECGCEIASVGIQVHGGMGYIEESGAAQHYRDARILPIYEGTNGIQALDLVSRKVLRDKGAALGALLAEIGKTRKRLADSVDADLKAIGGGLARGLAAVETASAWLLETAAGDARLAAAAATPYLRALGPLVGGWQMGEAALMAAALLEAGGGYDPDYLKAKRASALFFAQNILPRTLSEAVAAQEGAASVVAIEEAMV